MKNHFQSHRRITGPSKTQKQFVTDSIFQFPNRKNPVLFVVVNWIWCQRSPFTSSPSPSFSGVKVTRRDLAPPFAVHRPSIYNAKGVIHAIDMHQRKHCVFEMKKGNSFQKNYICQTVLSSSKENLVQLKLFYELIGSNWWGERWGPPTDEKRRRCLWYFQVDSKLNYRRLKGIRLEKKFELNGWESGRQGRIPMVNHACSCFGLVFNPIHLNAIIFWAVNC